MYVPEPGRTRLDLRGQLFGSSIRVQPLFWVTAGALGWGFYAEPERGGIGYFLLWILCVLISLLVHECGHVWAGRLLGARLGVLLYALGSRTTGMEALKRRQERLAVLLAGPLAQGFLLAVLWAVTWAPFPAFLHAWPWAAQVVANGFYMLLLINLFWPLLNLLPIWPLDGGLFAWEVCEGLFGPRGRAAALGICVFVSGLLALRIGQRAQALLPFRYDPRLGLQLQMYGILLVFCVLFVGSALQALRAEYRQGYGRPANPGGRA